LPERLTRAAAAAAVAAAAWNKILATCFMLSSQLEAIYLGNI
jgi:hypothetical protein